MTFIPFNTYPISLTIIINTPFHGARHVLLLVVVVVVAVVVE
jgi:hypothetical protein